MEKYRDWVRNLRGSRSSREFAKILGISQQALRAYEEGQRIPRDEVKRKLENFSLGESLFLTKMSTNSAFQKGEK